MNTHGHHSCAETAGEPLLKEAFERVGIRGLRTGAFYLGNWLTDVSQAVDPVAYMAFRHKVETPLRWIDTVIEEIRNHVGYQLVTSTRFVSDADIMEPINEAKAQLKAAFDRFFGDGDGGRDSTIAQGFKCALFSAGYFKFVHPEGPSTMAYAEGYRRVFEERFTQYYPHEHLDRPEKRFRPSEAPNSSVHPEAPPDFSQEIGGGLRSISGGNLKLDPDVYEYLRDDIEIASALIAEVDRDWASKVLTGESPLDDESPEFNMYLAMLGHALHAVEDFFAHSNFVEHAAELLGDSHRPEFYQVRSREVVQRRLKQWTEPGDETRDDWVNLPTERHVVTGFFDFNDTLVSLLHLLEEVFDAKTMGLGDQLHELHEGVESAPAHAQEKYDEYKKVLTETLEILDDPSRAWEDDGNDTAKNLKKWYEETKKSLRPDPIPREVAHDVVSITPLFRGVPPEVIENFVLACEYFGSAKTIYDHSMTVYGAYKLIAMFVAGPWPFIINKLKDWGYDWVADLVEHYTKQAFYDWIGQLRIGCHSLIAKDHGTEWLYKHQKNCALAVHHYVMKTLVRHAQPYALDVCRSDYETTADEQLNTADSRRWIDWLELLEYFLRNPRSVLTETKDATLTVKYCCTHTVVEGSGDSLASLAQRYSPTAEAGSLTWQRLADVNFDTDGLSDGERMQVINESLRDAGTGQPADDRGNYAFNPGCVVRIPDQIAHIPVRVVIEEQTCWFREIMVHETWKVFEGWESPKTRSSHNAIDHHTLVYITEDELNDLIAQGSDLRRTLERQYVPEGARPVPARKDERPPTRYDFYRQLIEQVGEFDSDDRCVNVIGVRAFQDGKRVENVADEYNDTIAIVWHEGGAKRCHEFVASVDPGEKYTRNPLVSDGCAHLVDGQYLYKKGTHRGNDALVQGGEVEVWRDKDRDHQRDEGSDPTESGWFGINIHAAGTGSNVGGWSAGCQVIKGGWSGSPWQTFKDRCYAHPKQTLRYTLVDGAEAARVEYPGGSSEGGDADDPPAETKVSSLLDVQRALNTLGYTDYQSKALVEDGENGPRTKSAVKSFQNARRLVVDGIAGPNTKASLEANLGEQKT